MYFEWQQIERWGRHLGDAAEELDQADHSKPESVDSGPFTAVVMDMVEATVAQCAHLVLRLDEAAGRLHEVAAYYRAVEEANVAESVVRPGDSLWSLVNPLEGDRRRAWDGTKETGGQ